LKFFIALLSLILLTSNSAFASIFHPHKGEYRVGLYKDSTFDPNKATHIIIIGSTKGKDSDQFFQSGVARAYRYKENAPDQQVVIMSSPEVRNTTDEEVFNKYNIAIISAVNETFTGSKLMQEMNKIQRIASIDYYGHASPWGLILGTNDALFDPFDFNKSLLLLKDKLLPNAYMTLNSCNTGFIIAPEISRVLQIPVSGSLTSAVFERIDSQGQWYKETDASNDGTVDNNDFSYKENVACSLGLCWRMKPSRTNYSSYWGKFTEGGLSFSKFFCNFDNDTTNRCEKGMANALLTFPSIHSISLNSSTLDFKDVAFDYLCSTANDKFYFNKCVTGIQNAVARGDLEFQTHPGNELNCDFKTCNAKIVCSDSRKGPQPGSCRLETNVNLQPTAASHELLSLLKGFELLKK
jgi:hypothetical protein